MVTKELIEYVEKCRKLGYSDSQIRANLRKSGWSQPDILEAMFKYTKPVKKSLGGKIYFIASIFFALLVAGVILLVIKDLERTEAETAELKRNIPPANVEQTQQPAQGQTEKIYRNLDLGFEIAYPDDIFVLDFDHATLIHKLKNFHKYSLKDGTDLGLAEDIKIVFKKDSRECDEAENTMEDIAEPFMVGDLRGLKYETGAEGEGMVLYCLRNDNGENIFTIARYFLSEAWSTDLVKQPDFIPSQKQQEIFDGILKTFKLL